MKKIAMILIGLLIVSLQTVMAQDVSYGTVRTDGYNKISKGAFWSSRPESKMVYNGSFPPGVEVVTLEQDYFVRFVENNGKDNNYIVFPMGEKIYYKNSRCFAAICGNEIEFIKPVDNIVIQRVVDSVYVDVLRKDTVFVYKNIYVESQEQPRSSDVVVIINDGYQAPYYQPMSYPIYWQPMPLCNTWGGGNYNSNVINNIDNSSYYYNNQVTNTTYNHHNPRPTPDPGGPGGANLNTNVDGPGGTGFNTNVGDPGGPGGTGNEGGPGSTGFNTDLGGQGGPGGNKSARTQNPTQARQRSEYQAQQSSVRSSGSSSRSSNGGNQTSMRSSGPSRSSGQPNVRSSNGPSRSSGGSRPSGGVSSRPSSRR